jgi:hypothetical protein
MPLILRFADGSMWAMNTGVLFQNPLEFHPSYPFALLTHTFLSSPNSPFLVRQGRPPRWLRGARRGWRCNGLWSSCPRRSTYHGMYINIYIYKYCIYIQCVHDMIFPVHTQGCVCISKWLYYGTVVSQRGNRFVSFVLVWGHGTHTFHA